MYLEFRSRTIFVTVIQITRSFSSRIIDFHLPMNQFLHNTKIYFYIESCSENWWSIGWFQDPFVRFKIFPNSSTCFILGRGYFEAILAKQCQGFRGQARDI